MLIQQDHIPLKVALAQARQNMVALTEVCVTRIEYVVRGDVATITVIGQRAGETVERVESYRLVAVPVIDVHHKLCQ